MAVEQPPFSLLLLSWQAGRCERQFQGSHLSPPHPSAGRWERQCRPQLAGGKSCLSPIPSSSLQLTGRQGGARANLGEGITHGSLWCCKSVKRTEESGGGGLLPAEHVTIKWEDRLYLLCRGEAPLGVKEMPGLQHCTMFPLSAMETPDQKRVYISPLEKGGI